MIFARFSKTSPPAYPTTSMRAGVSVESSTAVTPTCCRLNAAARPATPDMPTIERKYPQPNFTSLYEVRCLTYPTSPRSTPPANPQIKNSSILYDDSKRFFYSPSDAESNRRSNASHKQHFHSSYEPFSTGNNGPSGSHQKEHDASKNARNKKLGIRSKSCHIGNQRNEPGPKKSNKCYKSVLQRGLQPIGRGDIALLKFLFALHFFLGAYRKKAGSSHGESVCHQICKAENNNDSWRETCSDSSRYNRKRCNNAVVCTIYKISNIDSFFKSLKKMCVAHESFCFRLMTLFQSS